MGIMFDVGISFCNRYYLKNSLFSTSSIVSVALCTYNGERYLQEQLDSIYNQVMLVDEIIICDDNSQDNTLRIAHQFKDTHPELRIRIIENKNNMGVVKNFEKAISSCNGDIIFWSDQDDIRPKPLFPGLIHTKKRNLFSQTRY